MSTFFATAEEARAAGYRPCLRCKPDEVGRDREAVAQAVKLIEQAEEPPSLAELAEAVGYAPHHFQRLFKRDLGVSPAEYARGLRNQRAQSALKANGRVTDAIYDAGYSGPSGFYSDAKERLGMTPSAWRDGGRGETIRWTHFDSPIGPMLIAATVEGHLPADLQRQRGIAAAAVPPGDDRRGRRRPQGAGRRRARSDRASGGHARPADRRRRHRLPGSGVARAAQDPAGRDPQLCPDRRGDRRSPRRSARSASANGDNHVAVLIPCHRVIRSDGTLGGYAGGLDKKRKLLAAEGAPVRGPGTAAGRLSACRSSPARLNTPGRREGTACSERFRAWRPSGRCGGGSSISRWSRW